MKSYDKSKWQSVAFDKAIVTIAPKVKIPEKDFLPKGRFPIIDQAQKFISGFTNNENAINKIQKPVVIFGDHTCITKYIDFDFAQGADGIKILSTNSNILLPKYFYYWLLAYPIDSTEYKRHFSILKDKNIQCPNTKEQEYIIEKFTTIDERISNLEKLISKQESIKKSTINLLLKPNKDWETVKIKDVFTVTRGLVLSTTEMSKHKTDKTPFPVYSSQTQNNGLIGFYSAFLYQDAITWTTDGANAGFVRFRPGKFYCTNVCGVLLSEKGHANACIATILGSVSKKYVSYVGNPKLMNNVMAEIPISIPPIDQQKAIGQKLGAIDEHINNLKQQLKKQRNLKQGLMQYFFGD